MASVCTLTYRSRMLRTVAIVASALLAAVAAEAQLPEREPEGIEAAGGFPIEGEAVLVLQGIPGQIAVSPHKERSVQFTSKHTDRSGSARPIAVWFDGPTVTLGPPPGVTLPDGILRVSVPASFSIRARVVQGSLRIEGLSGSVEVKAKDAETRLLNLTGAVQGELDGGTLQLANVASVNLGVRAAAVEAEGVRGDALVRLAPKAKLTAGGVQGSLEIDGEGAEIKLQRIAGPLRMTGRGGTAEMSLLSGGGDLRLSGTPLKLSNCKGDLAIESDAAVEFDGSTSSLRFELDGGTLKGKNNRGPVEVRGRDAEVQLAAIEGTIRVQGDGLRVKLSDNPGEIQIDTSSSDVTLERSGGALGLKVDRGRLDVARAMGAVTATVYNADAVFAELYGPLTLDIDGGNADLGWAQVSGDRDTMVRSASGDVTVRIPESTACRVEAKTRVGRIDSSLPTVRVVGDAREAQGPVNSGRRPTIRIEAEGNVNLTAGSGGAPPPSPPPSEPSDSE
jgi:hypothetical protein